MFRKKGRSQSVGYSGYFKDDDISSRFFLEISRSLGCGEWREFKDKPEVEG